MMRRIHDPWVHCRLGWFWRRRIKRQARHSGTLQAARNLRKQGVPLKVALLLLT